MTREEIIKGLNDLHAVASGLDDSQCYVNGIGIRQLRALIDDATALLKAQEPRVMTRAELEEAEPETVVWCEQRDSIRSYMTPMIKYEDGVYANRYLGADPIAADSSDLIRFWTSRPTEEQRMAVK